MEWFTVCFWFLLTADWLTRVDNTFVQSLLEKQLQSWNSTNSGHSCSTVDVLYGGRVLDCEVNGGQVRHGVECTLSTTGVDIMHIVQCDDGQWSLADKQTVGDLKLHRVKRSGKLAGAITVDPCNYFCNNTGTSSSIISQPPTFNNCTQTDLTKIYYADRGERTTVVTWTPPTAFDSHGNALEPTQVSLPINGDRFEGSVSGYQHKVLYRAVDNDGLKAFCQFNITVKVRSCPPLLWPDLDCNEGNIYGSTCIFSCKEGYEITGNASVSCEENGNWTGGAACSKISCPEPPDLLNGTITCDDPEYSYRSVCWYSCNKGFSVQGPIFTQCQANGTWRHSGEQMCIDVEPPTLECVSPQIFYTDRGLLSTAVTWLVPSAYDNVDQQPNITILEGPSSGEVLPAGSTHVVYEAKDSSGNISPSCSVELKVLEISCDHPAKILTDRNLLFNCSESSLYYGVFCNLSCDYNLPLEGPSTITCEKTVENGVAFGSWQWEHVSQPYCRDTNCPSLDPPKNGYLIRETVNGNPVIIVECNENYSLPVLESFPGQIHCYHGSWVPVNKTTDCIVPQKPALMSLPAELYFYYSDNCSENTVKQEFLMIVSDLINPLYEEICPEDIKCSVGGVTVKCGQPAKRKKRSFESILSDKRTDAVLDRIRREDTLFVLVDFGIETEWVPGNMTENNAYSFTDDIQLQQKNALANLVNNGSLFIEGYTLKSDSFQTEKFGRLECDQGLKLDGTKCKPCPRGMFLNEDQKKCEYCPVGKYQDSDGNTTCKKCPDGYSTLQMGSKLAQDCKRLCGAGYASLTSMEPCTICPIGYYQELIGMTTCRICPRGKTTTVPGSKNQTECQDFDVYLKGKMSDTTLGNITADGNLTIVVWLKLIKKEMTPYTTLKLTNGGEVLLMMNISSTISLDTGLPFETGISLAADTWTHVAVVVTNGLLQVYRGGEKQIEGAILWPTQMSGAFVISSAKVDGHYLSGLQITNHSLGEEDIMSLIASCTKSAENPSISMDVFLGIQHSTVVVVTPAVCDAVDECTSSPCDDHQCLNNIDGFRCICSNGMSGLTCETPPDHCSNHECANGGRCESQRINYSCICDIGYSGTFCDIELVNGSRSFYGEWSACSVTCGEGVRKRSRSCDSPSAVDRGQNCTGVSEETESCTLGQCKDCPPPPQTIGFIDNCTNEGITDMLICNPTCPEGTVMVPDLSSLEYRCGAETNFEWIPFDIFPVCEVLSIPLTYGTDIIGSFEVEVPIYSKETVENKIKENLSATECVRKLKCDENVNLDLTSERVSNIQISLTVPLKSLGDLDIYEYISSGSTSAALLEAIDSIVILELTLAQIKGNLSEIFDVTIDSQLYTFNKSTLTVTSLIECRSGSVPNKGLCAKCPTGTKAVSGSCVFCNIETYQDETGQTMCKPCPKGYSSSIIGAKNITKCKVFSEMKTVFSPGTQFTSTTYTPTYRVANRITSSLRTTENTSNTISVSQDASTPSFISSDNVSSFGIGTIISIVAGFLALLLSSIAVAYILCRSRNRKPSYPRNMESSSDNHYIDMPGKEFQSTFSEAIYTEKADKELALPRYSSVLSQKTTCLDAGTSSHISGKDFNTDYFTPLSRPDNSAGSRRSEPNSGDVYLHARHSFGNSDEVETDKDQGYAMIPLPKSDKELAFPRFSFALSEETTNLDAGTSSIGSSKDSNTDYLTPQTRPVNSASSRRSEPASGDVYLHARHSFGNSDEVETNKDKDYATIPLPKSEYSPPPPYNKL